MTQNQNAPSERPRRVIPIIPAIPRCLEKKPKQESVVQKVEEKAEESVIPVATETSTDAEKKASAVSAHGFQNGTLDESDGQRDSTRVLEETTENVPEGKKRS